MARDVIQKDIELNREFVDWFKTQYPGGSLTAIINMLCDRFKEINQFTPKDYAEIAAKSVTEDLRDHHD